MSDDLERIHELEWDAAEAEYLEQVHITADAALDPQPKPPRITRTRWQLIRWHLRCAWRHLLGKRV